MKFSKSGALSSSFVSQSLAVYLETQWYSVLIGQKTTLPVNTWIKPFQYASSPSLCSVLIYKAKAFLLKWEHGIRSLSVNVIPKLRTIKARPTVAAHCPSLPCSFPSRAGLPLPLGCAGGVLTDCLSPPFLPLLERTSEYLKVLKFLPDLYKDSFPLCASRGVVMPS